MLKNRLSLLLFCALCFSACASAPRHNTGAQPSPAATRTPTVVQQTQPVTATVEEVRLTATEPAEAVIHLDISEGWYVNANPQTDKAYTATEVQAEPQEGITPGAPLYPDAQTRRLPFSERPLALYQGAVVIRLPLRADASTPKGRHTFRARIRYQPGNEREFQQPRTIEAYIPVTVD
ncbi:MAG TPA: hypothetical protein VGV59_15340 [Pyrinomonadaceae bacterium]|nr:hypothetical protein [Pyrinomonadaceae bacterium]